MRRRSFLLGLGSFAGLSALAWLKRNELVRWGLTHRVTDSVFVSANEPATASCIMSPEQTEGPFKARSLLRSDIREGRQGLRLDLNVKVVTGQSCQPLDNALVEIWHCDSAGRYSGYPEQLSRRAFDTLRLVGLRDPNKAHVEPMNDKTYLRGGQRTDNNGDVHFTTILPGWYDPRIPHIHVAVTVDDERRFTSQVYFPAEFTDAVYSRHPAYSPYGLCPYQFETDPVLADYADASGLMALPIRHGEGVRSDIRLVVG